jgi:hypothetical protein
MNYESCNTAKDSVASRSDDDDFIIIRPSKRTPLPTHTTVAAPHTHGQFCYSPSRLKTWNYPFAVSTPFAAALSTCAARTALAHWIFDFVSLKRPQFSKVPSTLN